MARNFCGDLPERDLKLKDNFAGNFTRKLLKNQHGHPRLLKESYPSTQNCKNMSVSTWDFLLHCVNMLQVAHNVITATRTALYFRKSSKPSHTRGARLHSARAFSKCLLFSLNATNHLPVSSLQKPRRCTSCPSTSQLGEVWPCRPCQGFRQAKDCAIPKGPQKIVVLARENTRVRFLWLDK